mgnify:CR=1 FL=1|jgi:hypothetical protein
MRIPTLIPFFAAALLAQQAQAKPLDMHCELGRQVSVAGDVRMDSAIDLNWKGKQYRMQRVTTSTGALRFEDQSSGLVWISIPSKAMLLDSRRGEPVANECKADKVAQLER